MIQKTANANRKHIAFFGKRNAGKSSLFNLLLGEDFSLVSKQLGTTTDPVYKAMELVGYGPVRLIDTAGLDDIGELGELRVKKSKEVLQKIDMAIYVLDSSQEVIEEERKEAKRLFQRFHIPYVFVWNKRDMVGEILEAEWKEKYPEDIYLHIRPAEKKKQLVDCIVKKLELQEEDPSLIGDLLLYGDSIIVVIPIDSEAPKGRLILPQVQLLRDCLDYGIKSYVVRDTELAEALQELQGVKLVITDSQIFHRVASMVPSEIPLISFSILFARQKGELQDFLEGIEALKTLKEKEKAKVFIVESCSHTQSHEDIGRVKIPHLLKSKLNPKIEVVFQQGRSLEEDLTGIDVIIHCGSCMLTRKQMLNRIQIAREQKIPITNYGIVLAYFAGILERSMDILKK